MNYESEVPDVLWELSTAMNYESEVPEVLWELSTAMNYESEVMDVVWELSTAMNYVNKIPLRIMISSCRDNIWASGIEKNDSGGTSHRKLKLIYSPKTENELSREYWRWTIASKRLPK